jgi:hypothetical protein
LRLHVDAHDHGGLSSPVAHAARESLVYVLPCMAPDGADHVLTTGGYVRSTTVNDRTDTLRARWRSVDVDGDGRVLRMRRRDPSGDFVESPTVPSLMVPRGIDDEGPFFQLYPEGVIDNFDGHHVPAWHFLDDNRTDLNRNFPYTWAPEGEQDGAGAYAGSTPEARAVLEFTSRAPHIMAWINLHTFGGVYIRPLGHSPDSKMNPGDLDLFRLVEQWSDAFTGYPTVSGFSEFVYVPEKPLRGDVVDYAYHQRGCLAVAIELWDLFQQAGLPRKKPFVDVYGQQDRADLEKIALWDRMHNQGRTVVPWKPMHHPQLGDVEVGGLDVRVGVWNPPYEMLDAMCRGQSAVFQRMLSLLPRVTTTIETEALGAHTFRVQVRVKNEGHLATHGIPSAKALALSEPLIVDVIPAGAGVVRDGARRVVGHLDGWGHGRFGGMGTWPYQATSGASTDATVSFVVDGTDAITVRVGSSRVGFHQHRVALTHGNTGKP